MRARALWSAMTADTSDVISRVTERLAHERIAYCVVGGVAVNAYVEPVVSLDLDLAVAVDDIERLAPAFAAEFTIDRFPPGLNLSAAGSDLRVQFQTDPRYAPFVSRAERRTVLGLDLPVARVEDVLQGKVWAASDPARRASKRQKDLAETSHASSSGSRLCARPFPPRSSLGWSDHAATTRPHATRRPVP
jgi:hypothetical protein